MQIENQPELEAKHILEVYQIKGTVFFSRKSLWVTHSLKIDKSVFFFFPEMWEKKKCFFFPGKVYKPLTTHNDSQP